MLSLKTTLFTLTLLFLGLYYINSQTHWITNRTYEVKDISKQETIILHKIKTQEHVHGFSLNITGHINGKAKIVLYHDTDIYKSATISNKVNLEWGGDWYTDTLKIEYEPIDVKDSELSLEYNFKGL